MALSKDAPILIYFCDEPTATSAGEGGIVAMTARRVNPQAKLTIFDNPVVVAEIVKSGVIPVKISITKDNAELIKKYRAVNSTLMFVAPTGHPLVALYGPDVTQSALIKSLRQVPEMKVAIEKARIGKK